MKATALVGSVVLAAVLTGCGAQKETPATPPASSGASPTVSASAASPTPEAESLDDVAWANAKALIEASLDDDYDTAREHVSPGSIAERYLDYHENFGKAHKINGVELEPYDATAEPDEEALSIQIVDDSDKPGLPLKDFQHDDKGLITSWTGRKPLQESIAPDTKPGKGLGQKVTLLGASAQKDGNLYVVVEIDADKTTYVDQAPSYVGEDKIRRTASGWVAPAEVEGGTKTLAVFVFDDTGLGGTMTYNPWNDSGDAKIKIKVG